MTPFEPLATYHVYTHANGSENLFRSTDNYFYFLKKYEKYLNPVVDTMAYCLMPNHLHFMIRVKPKDEVLSFIKESKPDFEYNTENGKEFSNLISRQFSHLFNGYTQAYNKAYRRRGSLFIPNVKRNRVTNDNYFTRLIIYIHSNPLHHNFAREFHEWPFSSYRIYLSDEESTILRKQEGLDWFGSKDEFIRIHHELRSKPLPHALQGS